MKQMKNMKHISLTLSILLLMSSTAAEGASRKNIVLVLIDDLGWMDLGCQGSTYYKTPRIDQLASEGVRFTDAYSACAVCSPTRASILTGKYPARLLLTDWLPSGRWDPKAELIEGRKIRGLPVEEFTLAEAMREAGYRTVHIGKWHLGSEPFCLPQHHGFDINIAGNAHGAPGQYFFPYQGNWSIPTTPHRAKWNVLPDGNDGDYLTDRLTKEAVKAIKEAGETPFFLYFPHYGVHTPLQAPDELIAKYEQIPVAKRQGKPVYAGMVESIDRSVGQVLDAIKETGKEDDTIIIFTSDNGGFYKATSNAPLRANKGSYYEGGIRVPLIIKWPGVSLNGRVIQEPVISNDLYPTCLSAAGLELNPHQHMDGINLKPLLNETERLPRETLFWHFPHYNSHPQSYPSSVIRKGDWKLIESFDPASVELYDLKQDIGETKNLAATYPDRRDALLEELESWRKAVRAEPMQPNPNAAKTPILEGSTKNHSAR